MAKEGRLWWVTRPTRELRDLKPALVCFSELAKGKKWFGNKALQKRFERENPAKTENAGSYGSGGRTWAALLRMWGLWYDDKCVTLTSAGEVIVSCNNVYQQIVRLIMNFQITSSYSEHQKLESGFKIFPFRFILKLLLDKKIKYLQEDEIALFLLQVKNPSEYDKVVKEISRYRKLKKQDKTELKDRKNLIANHMVKYRKKKRRDSPRDVAGHWKYIKDIANTLVVNIRFFHEIKYDRKKGTITLRSESRKKIKQLLDEYERDHKFSTLYDISEQAFVKHFGLRFDRKKASEKETKPQTGSRKQYKRIKSALEKLRRTGNKSLGSNLIKSIQEETNDQKEIIEKIISENPEITAVQTKKVDQNFADYYLDCAKSGIDHKEFEELTRKIFVWIGFETKKHRITRQVGAGKPEIDGLSLNKSSSKSGLLECKSGAKYTFPIGDCEKMKNVYIPNFRTKKVSGKKYSLDFFVYVVGNQTSGLENFKGIIQETKVDGTMIYAKEIINLYDLFLAGKITRDKIWKLFKSNKHVTWKDVEDISK